MDINGSWIQDRHMDIHLCILNKFIIWHGYGMDTSSRDVYENASKGKMQKCLPVLRSKRGLGHPQGQ